MILSRTERDLSRLKKKMSILPGLHHRIRGQPTLQVLTCLSRREAGSEIPSSTWMHRLLLPKIWIWITRETASHSQRSIMTLGRILITRSWPTLTIWVLAAREKCHLTKHKEAKKYFLMVKGKTKIQHLQTPQRNTESNYPLTSKVLIQITTAPIQREKSPELPKHHPST